MTLAEKETASAQEEAAQSAREEAALKEEVTQVEREVAEAEKIESSEPGALSRDFGTVRGCETAFAKGDRSFVDLGLTKSRWGWQVGPLDEGTHQAELWAGAGKNDTSKGALVGTLTVEVSGRQVRVTYETEAGNRLMETHLYVGTKDVQTISPGKLGHQHELDEARSDTFEVSGAAPVNLVAHAVVCGE